MRDVSPPEGSRTRVPTPSIADLLARHIAADQVEALHLARCQALAGALDDARLEPGPLSRAHWDPGHFTASAFVLNPQRDHVLLIFHRKLQRWLQPGGHFEPGERDPWVAAAREVAEEAGLTRLVPLERALLDVDVHEFPARGDAPAHAHFDLRVAFVSAGDDVRVGEEIEGARWVRLARPGSWQRDPSLLRPIEKLITCVGA